MYILNVLRVIHIILLVAGLNNLVKGGSRDSMMSAITEFRSAVDYQNRYHPGA